MGAIIFIGDEMKEISLLKLFTTFFKINSITFGGGYTIVPVIKDIFVEDLKLIDNDKMMDIVALSQGSPGAMAISCSILTGYKLRGPQGALVCLLASVLPCLIILSLISKFYIEFQNNFYIRSALEGISGVISAVLFITVIKMGIASYKKYPGFTLILIALIFVVAYFFRINTGILILFSAVIGISTFSTLKRRYEV